MAKDKSTKYITIQDAAEMADKSVQTIRRALKANKIKCRKKKTPQGFNYLIDRQSVVDFYSITDKKEEAKSTEKLEKLEKELTEKVKEQTADSTQRDLMITKSEFEAFNDKVSEFNKTISLLAEQMRDDKENFFRLIKTFQDRIVVLENHVRMIETPSQKKGWFNFWK